MHVIQFKTTKIINVYLKQPNGNHKTIFWNNFIGGNVIKIEQKRYVMIKIIH